MDGTPFGRYLSVELLGRGGMGEVWRAYDPDMNRVVALKVLQANFASDQVYQERFRREARSAAGLDLPRVVPIYEFGEVEGRLYVTMRLIRGHLLQALLERGRLERARAVGVIEQIASALHAAHEVRLVHSFAPPGSMEFIRWTIDSQLVMGSVGGETYGQTSTSICNGGYLQWWAAHYE